MDAARDPQWLTVAKLRPQLRQHVRTYPQTYRGQRWFVLLDESNGRNLRFNEEAYRFIGRLDGERTVEQIHQWLALSGADKALSRESIMLILVQLFTLDLLRGGEPASAKEFFDRFQEERRKTRNRAMMNPLAVRVPVVDPDRLLNRIVPWVRPLFSPGGMMIWSVVVGLALLLGILNFGALSDAADGDILAPSNLLLMLLLYVLIKIVHEMAHAVSVKMWGGAVHEMGVTLLVMVPVPYVDASATWSFREKRKRMMVGAVGILTELFIAAVALFVWLAVEPGLVRDMAFNIVLIASVSTLLFNGNPLLRFDGYYVLQDWIEIPNLATRASRYYLYLMQRHLFGLHNSPSPVTAEGERNWFAVYGLLAVFYRLFIMVTIVLFLAEEYFFIGVLLGAWALVMQVLLPLGRGLHWLVTSPALAARRGKATGVALGSVFGLLLLLLVVPVSLVTRAEGVVWVPDQAQVYAGASGFIDEVLVPSGTWVEADTPLLRLRNPLIETGIAVQRARLRALEVQRASDYLTYRVKSDIVSEEMIAVQAELDRLLEQRAALLVRSGAAGTFTVPDPSALNGAFRKQGELIGYIVSPKHLIVRTILQDADIGLMRSGVDAVSVRLVERPTVKLPAVVLRETPAAIDTLPSAALGVQGGGEIAVRRDDPSGRATAEDVFQVDLGLGEQIRVSGVRARAWVRFDHGSEPILLQWYRRFRQLLLRRLSF